MYKLKVKSIDILLLEMLWFQGRPIKHKVVSNWFQSGFKLVSGWFQSRLRMVVELLSNISHATGRGLAGCKMLFENEHLRATSIATTTVQWSSQSTDIPFLHSSP